MNIINNTLISLKSDKDIKLTSSIISDLDQKNFTIQIGDVEHYVSIETIQELKLALTELQDITNYVN